MTDDLILVRVLCSPDSQNPINLKINLFVKKCEKCKTKKQIKMLKKQKKQKNKKTPKKEKQKKTRIRLDLK